MSTFDAHKRTLDMRNHANNKNRRPFRRCQPTFELLESRWTPAGTVTASFVGGSLILTGDAADNAIFLSTASADDTLRINSDSTTSIRIGTVVFPPGTALVLQTPLTGNITANMRGGDDQVDFFRLDVPGFVTIYGEEGDNYFQMTDSTIGGNLTIINGNGEDSVRFGDVVKINGNVLVNNGSGGSLLRGADLKMNIGGSFTVLNGTGADVFVLSGGGAANSEVFVGGRLTIANGGAPTDSSGFGLFADSIDLGGLTVTSGGGDDTIEVYSTEFVLRDSMYLNMGNGINSVVISTSDMAIRSASVVNGVGENDVRIEASQNASFGGPITINNAISNGSDIVRLIGKRTLAVSGAVTILNGSGASTTELQSARLRVNGPVTINAGNGVNQVHVGNATSTPQNSEYIDIDGVLTVIGGTGGDSFTIGRDPNSGARVPRLVLGGFTANPGEGSDRVVLEPNRLNVRGSVLVNALGGNDFVFVSPFKGNVSGAVTINGGTGNDTISVQGREPVSLDSLTIARHGNSTDSVTIEDILVNGPTFVSLGPGNDRVIINDGRFGAITLFTAEGDDDLGS